MQNIETKIDGNKLIIEVDLSQEFGTTKSGKSITIASSGGGVPLPGREGVKINLNVYKPSK